LFSFRCSRFVVLVSLFSSVVLVGCSRRLFSSVVLVNLLILDGLTDRAQAIDMQ
jgi:hypothetical protein